MADEDDDEVVIEGETDTGPDDSDADEATGNGDPRVAAGGGVTQVVQVKKGTRPISAEVRRVFAESMAKAKAKGQSLEDEGELEPVDHEELPAEKSPVLAPKGDSETTALGTDAPAQTPVVTQPPAAAPVVPAPAAAPAASPPVVPPAPSLDPEVMRLKTDLEQQRSAFEAEKQKWFDTQRTSDVTKLRDTYFDKGAPAVVEMVKQWTGVDGDDLKREVADLIQDLAHQYLEAPLDEGVKDRITNKRVRAGLKTWKQEQERAEQERQKQIAASQKEAEVVQTKKILHQEVLKPEHAAQFPYLALEDHAGTILFDVIDSEFKKGRQLTWKEAAQLAETWLKEQSSAFFDKRKHLLSPTPTQPAPSEKQRAQGDTQVQQVTRAAKPKPTPPATPPSPPKKWTPESHRQNTMSKWRPQLKAQYADDE